eukprot:m51a1_g901 hypothetical protein (267) ;mRNA; r:45400-46325
MSEDEVMSDAERASPEGECDWYDAGEDYQPLSVASAALYLKDTASSDLVLFTLPHDMDPRELDGVTVDMPEEGAAAEFELGGKRLCLRPLQASEYQHIVALVPDKKTDSYAPAAPFASAYALADAALLTAKRARVAEGAERPDPSRVVFVNEDPIVQLAESRRSSWRAIGAPQVAPPKASSARAKRRSASGAKDAEMAEPEAQQQAKTPKRGAAEKPAQSTARKSSKSSAPPVEEEEQQQAPETTPMASSKRQRKEATPSSAKRRA